jgi:1,2-diacylglycerol 3-beta-galactosyltransferase
MTKKRLLFLLSDTGGGHRASAEAIAEGLEHEYPGEFEAIIEDVWKDSTPFPFNQVPNSYGWLTGPGLPIWKLMWDTATHGRAQDLLFRTVDWIASRDTIAYLRRHNPDIVIAIHPLMNHLGVQWMREAGLGHIPFITVVTDMVTIHPTWICPEVDLCLVPTAEAYARALELGMPAEKLQIGGQPVKLKFMDLTPNRPEARRELGLAEHHPTVLLIGGGEGYGKLDKIATEIATAVSTAQLLIITGRNQRLRQRLEALQPTWPIPSHIYGFVQNMPQLMSAADILITKAGPGTLSEAFIAGLPPIIFGYIPGQELGNVAYVQQHEAGAYATEPQAIAQLVQAWADPHNDRLRTLAANAKGLARPTAVLDIAHAIHACWQQRQEQNPITIQKQTTTLPPSTPSSHQLSY